MKIANFLIKPTASQEVDPQPPTPSSPGNFNAGFIVNSNANQSQAPMLVTSAGIWNDHEPLSSDDPPSPQFANYFKNENYLYHRIAGSWKRSPLTTFKSQEI